MRWFSTTSLLFCISMIVVPQSLGIDDSVADEAATGDAAVAARPQSLNGPNKAPNAPPNRVGTAAANPRSVPDRFAARTAMLRAVRAAVGPARSSGHRSTMRRQRRSVRVVESMLDADMLRIAGDPLDIAQVRHESYRIQKAGWPVLNRTGRLHSRDGRIVGHTGRLSIPPLAVEPPTLTAADATALARAIVRGSGERAPPSVERGWLALEGADNSETVPAWRITLARAQPIGTWRVDLDARDGRVISNDNLLRTVTGQGRVYPENAVTTPTPQSLPLVELDTSGFLSGRFTQVFDVRVLEAFRPDQIFEFDEVDPRFAQTAIYRGLSDGALYAEGHGLPAILEPVTAFANLRGGSADEEFNNAFYDPFFPIFGFGNGDGVVTSNLSTDTDVGVHEMGHHIFQLLVDPLGSSSLFNLGAINEGFADSLAALVANDPEIGESTIPGQPFLRTVANSSVWPDDIDIDPHVEGLIYGGLNWDLKNAVGADVAAATIIAGLPFLDPGADFPAHRYREALVMGDQARTGGVNRSTIESLALARGIEDLDALGVEGFVDEGIPATGNLAEGEFLVFYFSEFPNSKQIRFSMTGIGDADMLVAPLEIFDPNDFSSFIVSEQLGPNEFIQMSSFTTPSVNDGDAWLIAVADFVDGQTSTFELTVTSDPPDPSIAIGGSFDGSIEMGGEFDLITFSGSAGQIVRLEATAFEEDLDLAITIFDPATIEVFGAADDTSTGVNPLIQGAALPRNQIYAIAVFSLIADIDPTVGTGDYRLDLSACNNVGPDFDGDGQVDACDDDDDDDSFVDDFDTDPFDKLLCQDVEGDSCDDCQSGVFDPFDDGANNDGDHLCDAGDTDDDNDGCEDELDPFPFSPRADEDFDLIGDDCDNCLGLSNPDQLDSDDDGLGNLCDPTPMPEPSQPGAFLIIALTLAVLRVVRVVAAGEGPTRP